ncbi:MAG: hypothetical protein WDN25_17005 [Acetobacteraceae bacterium]
MAEILYAPDRDRVVTTNAWAFLHWLRLEAGGGPRRMARAAALVGRAAAGIPRRGRRVCRRRVCRRRFADTGFGGSRRAAAATPARLLADLLLHADLRPTMRWWWPARCCHGLPARHWGTSGRAGRNRRRSGGGEKEHATVLVAPAQALATAGFRRPRPTRSRRVAQHRRHGRAAVARGARPDLYGVKSDVMLLARTGETLWGNPLEPVLASPPATPAFLTPPPSAPAPR